MGNAHKQACLGIDSWSKSLCDVSVAVIVDHLFSRAYQHVVMKRQEDSKE